MESFEALERKLDSIDRHEWLWWPALSRVPRDQLLVAIARYKAVLNLGPLALGCLIIVMTLFLLMYTGMIDYLHLQQEILLVSFFTPLSILALTVFAMFRRIGRVNRVLEEAAVHYGLELPILKLEFMLMVRQIFPKHYGILL